MNIKEQFPKSYQKLKEWMKPRLVSMQEAVLKEMTQETSVIPEVTDSILEKFIEISLQTNVRLLYDFLDEYKIRLFPEWVVPSTDDEDRESLWTFSINEEILFDSYKTRLLAETAGFKTALEKLEKQ